ncbi:Hypothetical predicted protein [Cloeon dipterum]|uniref:Uncharacterized protein n=1 Tax=Cloeon dipterum TaxID=197152 RepID=A0A8S1DFT4_9INSE|nr:Hypothetical predicted protein [Cloeon dipterum]
MADDNTQSMSSTDGKGSLTGRNPEQVFSVSSTTRQKYDVKLSTDQITRMVDDLLCNMSIETVKGNETVRDKLECQIKESLDLEDPESDLNKLLEDLTEKAIKLEKNVECTGMTLVEFRDKQAEDIVQGAQVIDPLKVEYIFGKFMNTEKVAGKKMEEAVAKLIANSTVHRGFHRTQEF